jgi:hypothetical protein
VRNRIDRLIQLVSCTLLVACGSSHHDGPAPTGTIVGTVSSSLGGPLVGATVVVTPNTGPALTAATVTAAGTYRVAEVPLDGGDGTLTVGALPAGCTVPTPVPYTGLTNRDSITVDVNVVCISPVGTVAGTVSTAVGGVPTPLATVKVTVTPTGGSAQPAASTSALGGYSVANVPVNTGAGLVAVSSLPANCTTPAPVAYTGLTVGGTVTANVNVACMATTGNLTVTLNAPSNIGADAAVVAPNGAVYTVTNTQTLTGLTPGSYIVTAPSNIVVPGPIVNSVYVSAVTGTPVTISAGATATAGVTYTLRPGSGSVWVTNQGGTAVQLSAAQIATSGSPVPPVILSGLPSANALSFDGNGNLWIASGSSGNDKIIEYTASQLNATSSPTPALTLTSVNQSISLPQQIAFDPAGNLWVGNQIAGTVVEFAASQLTGLTGSHALAPAVTLTSADWGANAVGTIAFDVHGTLWVYGFSSGKVGVYGYAPSSLTASGAVTATSVVTNSTFSSGPQTVLFDPSGHLWVTTDGSVVEFTPAQLAAGGSQTATVTIVLPGTNAFINAAGFDDGGDLWVADGGSSAIFAYTATQLGTGGSSPPAITISSNSGSLSSPTAIGFDPHGIGVPLANRVRGTPPRAY